MTANGTGFDFSKLPPVPAPGTVDFQRVPKGQNMSKERKQWRGFKAGTTAKPKSLLPDGVHLAHLVSIDEVTTRFGDTCRLNYEAFGPDGKVYLNELAEPSPVLTSKFCRRLANVNGLSKFDEGTDISAVPTYGPILLEVTHTFSDDGEVNNKVINAMPVPPALLAAGAASHFPGGAIVSGGLQTAMDHAAEVAHNEGASDRIANAASDEAPF